MFRPDIHKDVTCSRCLNMWLLSTFVASYFNILAVFLIVISGFGREVDDNLGLWRWDRLVLPKRRQKIITTRRVINHKIAVLSVYNFCDISDELTTAVIDSKRKTDLNLLIQQIHVLTAPQPFPPYIVTASWRWLTEYKAETCSCYIGDKKLTYSTLVSQIPIPLGFR